MASEMGFIVPSIHIRDNLQLRPNEYAVLIKGVEVAEESFWPDITWPLHRKIRARDQGGEDARARLRASRHLGDEDDREAVQASGLVVVDTATVITTHLTELIKNHVDELIGRMEVQTLVGTAWPIFYPKIVEELVPKVVPLGVLQKVLQRLLRERVSIRDLITIVETLADLCDHDQKCRHPGRLCETGVSRSITRQYMDENGNIVVLMVAPECGRGDR